MSALRAAVANSIALVAAGAATPALGCPRCFGSSPSAVVETYYLSTLMLSLLPFALVGGLALVAVRLARRGAGESIGPRRPTSSDRDGDTPSVGVL